MNTRRSLIEEHDSVFSKRRQCKILSLQRSGLYYQPAVIGEDSLRLMRAIDEEYLLHLFYGRRRMTIAMRKRGFDVGPKKIRTAMRTMGLEAIYPKPNLSTPNKKHKKYPYLLRNLEITRPNKAWAADITYIPMGIGFGYLFAIIDLTGLVKPEIFNTDQGVQFTSHNFTGKLEENGIRVSMDGRGRALDNVFIERLWRSVKHENIYPKAYETLKDVKQGLTEYFKFYNEQRPHQGLGYRTPAEVYHER